MRAYMVRSIFSTAGWGSDQGPWSGSVAAVAGAAGFFLSAAKRGSVAQEQDGGGAAGAVEHCGWFLRMEQSSEHRAQSTEHRAQSIEHRAQSIEHRAQSSELSGRVQEKLVGGRCEFASQRVSESAGAIALGAIPTQANGGLAWGTRAQSTEHRAQGSADRAQEELEGGRRVRVRKSAGAIALGAIPTQANGGLAWGTPVNRLSFGRPFAMANDRVPSAMRPSARRVISAPGGPFDCAPGGIAHRWEDSSRRFAQDDILRGGA